MKRQIASMVSRFHQIPANIPFVGPLYLRMLRVFKFLPDGKWKARLESSIDNCAFPDVALSDALVELAPGVSARMVPHIGEFDFSAHLFRRMPYEQEIASWLIGRYYDVIIEIGANIGFYTVLFSKLFPYAKVYSFEPAPTPFRRLLENLALNDCPNVIPFQCAISDEVGFLDFFEPEGHLTNGSLDRSFASAFASTKCTKVPCFSGQELQRLAQSGKKMLIKIDAEGSEAKILRTLESLIMTERPDMILEVIGDVPEQLNQIGFLSTYRLLQLLPGRTLEAECFTQTTTYDYVLEPRILTV